MDVDAVAVALQDAFEEHWEGNWMLRHEVARALALTAIEAVTVHFSSLLFDKAEKLHTTAAELTVERGKHHGYLFGEASGLRKAAELLASSGREQQ